MKTSKTKVTSPSEIKNIVKLYSKTDVEFNLNKRIELLKNFCEKLKNISEKLAKIQSEEIGTIYNESLSIVNRTPERIMFLCEEAKKIFSKKKKFIENNINIEITRKPLGIVLIISSWNYPIDIPLASIVPAFLSGNRILFKPSEYAQRTGTLLGNLLEKTLSKNYFNTIFGDKKIVKKIINEEKINLISFTGTTEAAIDIQKNSKYIKKFHLNLTGKDSSIIMPDVENLKYVCKEITKSRIRNNGASCSSTQSVYIHEKIYTKAVHILKQYFSELEVGQPFENKDLGRIANKRLFDNLNSIIKNAPSNAKIFSPKNKLPRGLYINPTIIELNINNTYCSNTDVFGPILFIYKYKNIEKVIAKINESPFGLTNSIWTKNTKYAKIIANKINCGTQSINCVSRSSINVPWTGTKQSGFGIIRSKYSILEFCRFNITRTV